MNKERIKKWIKALRSDKYKQIQGSLADGEGCYCVLGLACEVSDVGEWLDHGTYGKEEDAGINFLPRCVMNYYGLTEKNPNIIYKGKPMPLSYLNDSNVLFKDLADLMENQYLG